MRLLVEINLPGTKADCVSEISEGRQAFNLWHNTLDIILYPTLHKLIGLSSVIFVGLSILGIKQIFIIFNLASSFPKIKKLMTTSCKSFFLLYAKSVRKIELSFHPVHELFSGCIINMTCSISSSVPSLINRWFIWGGDGRCNLVQKTFEFWGESYLKQNIKIIHYNIFYTVFLNYPVSISIIEPTILLRARRFFVRAW